MRKAIAALALVFLASHLPFLPHTLEDIDSINFALGVADFDVARHQPHPPGYPIFIALGRMSTYALGAAGVAAAEPRGLALWSAVSGAAAVVLLFAFFLALEPTQGGAGRDRREAGRDRGDPGTLRPDAGTGLQSPPFAERNVWRAWWAAAIAALSPLFWFTAVRPLSDTTGLAGALAAQVLIVSVITRRATARTLLFGAFLAGVAIGVRSQTLLLTLPLLAVALAVPAIGLRARDRVGAIVASAAGVLLWGAPLIVASGGLSSYAAALGSQAGEDFSGVVMLWTTRTPRVVVDTFTNTFLWPWGHPVAGAVVLVVAAAGCVRLAWRMPWTLGLLAVAFVPYAIFHMLFHETVTVRYALPLVVPVAYLAACALEWPGRHVLPAGAIALATWSLVLAVPAMRTYAREGSPAFRALRDVMEGGVRDPGAPRPVLGMHAVFRRASDWLGKERPMHVLKAPHGREWLTLIQRWRSHPRSVVLFVADPRRTDLALFDAAARSGPAVYRWGFVQPPFVGGARPGDADVYAMHPPGWMLDRGWAVTAEVAGVTARDGLGPHRQPSVAWIRSRADESMLMIGGRHLGAGGDPGVRMMLTLNGRALEAFEVPPGFFLQLVTVPAGALVSSDAYLRLEVKSQAADGREQPVALEQFDVQSAGIPMIGVREGWQEPEYNPLTARAWRWAAERSTLWVRPVGRDVTLTLYGESPLRYYNRAPVVTVTVAGREIARFTPSSDFTQQIVLPADALASADGLVVIESDKWFVPGERDGTADKRHLALRIYSYSVR